MVKYEKPELELVEFLAVDVITVSILDGEEIGVEELGFYKEEGSFVVEKGDFYIYVGKDSLDNNRVKINVC